MDQLHHLINQHHGQEDSEVEVVQEDNEVDVQEGEDEDHNVGDEKISDGKNQNLNKKLFHYVELLELWLEDEDFHSQQQL